MDIDPVNYVRYEKTGAVRAAQGRAPHPRFCNDRKCESFRKDDAKVYKDIVHVPLRRLPKGRAQFVPHKVLCAHSRFL